ncbi:hypothetical protein E4413_14925 [Leptospira interrogans]|nr:hypothetical protein E4413_14925 [Leptospira interrogans]
MGTTIKYKKNHCTIRCLHKTAAALRPSSKFKSYSYASSMLENKKEFSKNMSSYNFRICS